MYGCVYQARRPAKLQEEIPHDAHPRLILSKDSKLTFSGDTSRLIREKTNIFVASVDGSQNEHFERLDLSPPSRETLQSDCILRCSAKFWGSLLASSTAGAVLSTSRALGPLDFSHSLSWVMNFALSSYSLVDGREKSKFAAWISATTKIRCVFYNKN